MLFSSYEFVFVFLPLCLIGFAFCGRLHPRLGLIWLVLASFAFYAFWIPAYTVLLAGLLVANYGLGRWVARTRSNGVLALAVGLNLSVLAYYKYAGFFLQQLPSAWTEPFASLKILLPLGISFFIFQKIAYLVDMKRGVAVRHGFLDYCLFVTFFPQLIAGPIVHPGEVLPQFTKRHLRLTARNLGIGLGLFSLGLFKKIVLADRLGLIATPVFDAAAQEQTMGALDAWSGALAYGLQIYFDFSGYSDMAVGLGRMFGVRLPVNFNSPYQACSMIAFWRRWHMTLSRFLRDYLYFPLGGNRKGPIRQQLNLFVVMLLGGLWHGAGWTFILWGGLHGIYLAVNHLWLAWRSPALAARLWMRLVSWLLTFLAVTVAWTLFRAADLASALHVYAGMLGVNGFNLSSPITNASAVPLLFGGLAIALVLPNSLRWISRARPVIDPSRLDQRPHWFPAWRPSLVWGVLLGFVFACSTIMMGSSSEFLYFQF